MKHFKQISIGFVALILVGISIFELFAVREGKFFRKAIEKGISKNTK